MKTDPGRRKRLEREDTAHSAPKIAKKTSPEEQKIGRNNRTLVYTLPDAENLAASRRKGGMARAPRL